ncbi:MAG TPA: tRNA (adenosine(37)-N6)-threonylcarbamoyltransferase complex dimerization subunit type 1 TsaB [Terracidiphilus sp.]|nr:tRNA (adenosine(37)-N6)-threonylcarbamoyltransferase complex dimerization subunit type 1 TsaB [Terracidiphilus sp.]
MSRKGNPEQGDPCGQLILGVDTCGPSGSVALGRLAGPSAEMEILGQAELAGRSYSATLVAAVSDLLSRSGLLLREIGCIVAVKGPGSFTGVRVGLSAVKGLSEPSEIPIVAISRLEVLAAKAGTSSSALDAHRSEVFLRLGLTGKAPIEMLAGAVELAAIELPPAEIGVCDHGAAALLQAAWPSTRLARVAAPAAADALHLAAPRVIAGDFDDPLLLDGHYLRRSDAEIFGEPGARPSGRA